MQSLQTRQVTTTEVDHSATGAGFRARREKLGLPVREIARRTKLSAAYVSDLERGRRNWDSGLVAAFEKAIKK